MLGIIRHHEVYGFIMNFGYLGLVFEFLPKDAFRFPWSKGLHKCINIEESRCKRKEKGAFRVLFYVKQSLNARWSQPIQSKGL